MAAKVTLDAAVAAVLSGKEDALDALGLEASDTGGGCSGSECRGPHDRSPGHCQCDNLLRLSKALTAEGKERMKLSALSKDRGLEGRATALLMRT